MNMEYRQLGKTGERIFVTGLGTYGFGEAYGGISKSDSYEVFRSVANNLPDSAKLLVDTAPRYGLGKVEKWLGQFVGELGKEKILIATKGGRHIEPSRTNEKDFSHEFLEKDLEESLKRLAVDQIFLYQLHNPCLEILTEGSVFDLLEEFRDKGKIGFYGVSIDSPEEGIAAIDICRWKGYNGLASIQVIYNILNKSANEELFKIAKESNVAVIAREPLFRGFLTDKYCNSNGFFKVPPARKKEIDLYSCERIQQKIKEVREVLQKHEINEPLSQVAIQFVISNPNITLTIPGTNRLEYVEPNLNAVNLTLNRELLSELNDITNITSSCETKIFSNTVGIS